jgi:hypothetical protein
MPRGPKGENRPADAVIIARIALTGEIEDITTEDGKNAAAVALAHMGARREQKACQPSGAMRLLRLPLKQIGPRPRESSITLQIIVILSYIRLGVRHERW